jgi:hypothetical protein
MCEAYYAITAVEHNTGLTFTNMLQDSGVYDSSSAVK